jgi:hypothetical protein
MRTARMALLLGPEGAHNRRVCKSCADGGLLVVAAKVVPVVSSAPADAREEKEILAPYVAQIRALLKGLKGPPGFRLATAQDLGFAPGGEDHGLDARREALEGVLKMLTERRA